MFYIRKGNLEDLIDLRKLQAETFVETFKPYNTEENMASYIKESFNEQRMKEELSNNASSFFLLFIEDKLSGYLKLNEVEAQTDIKDVIALEIERIYIYKEYQGGGFGQVLMDKALQMAEEKGLEYIWLGVWEKNIKAIGFYERNQFTVISSHSFILGDDNQTDLIMKRIL